MRKLIIISFQVKSLCTPISFSGGWTAGTWTAREILFVECRGTRGRNANLGLNLYQFIIVEKSNIHLNNKPRVTKYLILRSGSLCHKMCG